MLGLAWRALLADNYSRVVVSELVGCFVSFAHLLLRYACLKFDLKKEPPLSKLAGPMSVCDSAASVLLSFSNPPLLGPHYQKFDAVARMLVGLLIVVVALNRCYFACASCGLLSATVSSTPDTASDMYGYSSILPFLHSCGPRRSPPSPSPSPPFSPGRSPTR